MNCSAGSGLGSSGGTSNNSRFWLVNTRSSLICRRAWSRSLSGALAFNSSRPHSPTLSGLPVRPMPSSGNAVRPDVSGAFAEHQHDHLGGFVVRVPELVRNVGRHQHHLSGW